VTEDEPPVRVALALRRADGDTELLKELVTTFKEDLPERVALLKEAIRRGDPQEIFRAAHSLAGPLGILGAAKALSLAQELEALGRMGQLEDISTICAAFEREITRVAAFFSSSDWADRA